MIIFLTKCYSLVFMFNFNFLDYSNIFYFLNYSINWFITSITPVFFIENFILQFFIVYLLYLISINSNIYYILLYIFLEFVLMGIFISYFQMELFTGFLWVVEFTVIFISVVLLFYLNVDGLYLKYNNNFNIIFYIPFLFFFLVFFKLEFFNEMENFIPSEFIFIDYYDDFYEALNNYIMNDFTPLTLSYYSVNSLQFLIIGLLLLIGSLACVNLYKSNKNYIIVKQSNLLNLFDFFKDFINFSFIRKQDLNKQTNLKPNLRSVKKN